MTRYAWIIAGSLAAATWLGSLIVYPNLPDQIPTHWNIEGEPDKYGQKEWAAFLTPMIMTGMLGLFGVLPWLSPKQFEIGTFQPTYRYLIVLISALFAYIHGLILFATIGGSIDVSRALIGGICLMTALMGNVLGKVRKNFYVGIRTPWTLASDRVWADTHRLGAWCFVGGGILGLILAIAGWPGWAMAPIIAAAIVPIIYSLIRYKELENKGGLE